MRRERFHVDISNIDWITDDSQPNQPIISIHFDGTESDLREWLRNPPSTNPFDSQEIDISFRLQGSFDDPESRGVIALTNRITGDYVLEVNVRARDVLPFIKAARRFGERRDDSAQYRVIIRVADGQFITFEKQTLLVYSYDGELLRQDSLIPSGVEI